MCVCECMRVCICLYVYVCLCVCARKCMCMYVYLCVLMCVCACECMSVYMCMCACECVCVVCVVTGMQTNLVHLLVRFWEPSLGFVTVDLFLLASLIMLQDVSQTQRFGALLSDGISKHSFHFMNLSLIPVLSLMRCLDPRTVLGWTFRNSLSYLLRTLPCSQPYLGICQFS